MSFKVVCGGQRLSVSGHGETYSGLAILLVCLALVSCGKERPAPHTPEYREAHGLVEGGDNRVEVSGVPFRVPSDLEFDVYSAGDIRPGKADELTLHLFIDQAGLHKGNPVPTARDSRIRVENGRPQRVVLFRGWEGEGRGADRSPSAGPCGVPIERAFCGG